VITGNPSSSQPVLRNLAFRIDRPFFWTVPDETCVPWRLIAAKNSLTRFLRTDTLRAAVGVFVPWVSPWLPGPWHSSGNIRTILLHDHSLELHLLI